MSVGQPLDRVDGRAKVTGGARYTTEHPLTNVAHAALVMSTIARGRIASVDTRPAESVRGVLAVLTHVNAPRLPAASRSGDHPPRPSDRVLQLLQDDVVRYANQPVAVVVAETLEAAHEAAGLVRVAYATDKHDVRLEPRLAEARPPKHAGRPDQPPASAQGDVDAALAEAEVKLEQVYRTPFETHVPMEPHATIAVWEGPARLTLYDATQGIFGCRQRVADLLGLKPDDVHVISPYLGGGFGSKGPTWSHVVLAAMAARRVNRPVKLALRRPQTFGPVGFRSRTRASPPTARIPRRPVPIRSIGPRPCPRGRSPRQRPPPPRAREPPAAGVDPRSPARARLPSRAPPRTARDMPARSPPASRAARSRSAAGFRRSRAPAGTPSHQPRAQGSRSPPKSGRAPRPASQGSRVPAGSRGRPGCRRADRGGGPQRRTTR